MTKRQNLIIEICIFSGARGRTTKLVARGGNFPRGCNETQPLALSRAGYLVRIPDLFADGREEVRYEITA